MRDLRVYACAILLMSLASRVASGEQARTVTSETQACDVLKRTALALCLSRTNLDGRYYCDPTPRTEAFYIIGLRYEVRPGEDVGSNLIGWYGVRETDGRVFEWDINEDQPRPLESHCPFESE